MNAVFASITWPVVIALVPVEILSVTYAYQTGQSRVQHALFVKQISISNWHYQIKLQRE
jgi:hypothetical protein